jgi:hypothetical protein
MAMQAEITMFCFSTRTMLMLRSALRSLPKDGGMSPSASLAPKARRRRRTPVRSEFGVTSPGNGKVQHRTVKHHSFSAAGKFTSNLEQADPEKKKAFIASITTGNFNNQAEAGAESAISCIMARTSAEKKREVSWEEIMKSRQALDPKIELNKLS